MKKLIGVTPRLLTEGTVEKQFVNCNYINALQKYDCNCIMLTTKNPALEEVLSLCDGLLVTGGADLDPMYYGEKNEGKSEEVSKDLDDLDKQVIEYAVKNKIPLLGICRGHQSINVFLGGSLHQHIDGHSNIVDGHEVETLPNRMLKFDSKIIANSYHHQAVNKLAPDMIEIARHIDGTNEAIIHKDLPIIGIQWHPEKSPEKKESKIIFDKFFELIKEFKKL